jgi:hypothetical protein
MFLIKVIKEVRISLENYVCTSDVLEGRYVRLNYSGLPRILKEAIHLFKQDDSDFKRLLFSLLTIARTAIFEKSPDYSTITSATTGTQDVPTEIFASFVQLLSNRIESVKVVPVFQNYHFSVRSSPLGDNSMESMMIELFALTPAVRNAIYKIGGKDLEFRMKFIYDNSRKLCVSIPGFTQSVDKLIKQFKLRKDFIYPTDIFDKNDRFYTVFLSNYIRKLVSFAEYEGKTRIIGLCDYWTQVALSPLADRFFTILRAIDQDRTFDQSRGCKELLFLNNSVIFYSIDLTAFTDRFPMTIISALLVHLYGKEYSETVTFLLSGVPFWCPDSKTFISYEVGNPMGTKASWALTTVCHHLIIYWACINLKIKFKTAKYIMLGDDIAIWCKKLALEYQRLLKLIGVGVSSTKTITGTTGFSFAKRIFTSTGELSPVSYRLWTHSLQDWPAMIELIKLTRERSKGLVQSNSYLLEKSFILALTINNRPRSFVNKFWIKNKEFLLDLTIQKKNILDRVTHIIKTYGGPNLNIFYPWTVFEDIACNILKPIMLSLIKKEILEFQGRIELQPENIPVESQADSFNRDYLIAFGLADVDEMNDLLSICVPHLSINQRLVEEQLYSATLRLSKGTVSNEELVDLFTGLKILNYDMIIRQKNKSSELSPVSTRNIEISKFLIIIKNALINAVKLQLVSLVNRTPLMVISNVMSAIAIYNKEDSS